MTNKVKKIKIFETAISYIFLASLISGFLLIGKFLEIYHEFSAIYNRTFKFNDMLIRFFKYLADFKHLEALLLIHRIVILALCIVLILIIIYRIATKEILKLRQLSTVLSFVTTIYSCYLIYLTSGVYNALKLLNVDINNGIYLAYKLQKIKDLRYIIMGVFLLVILLSLISLIVNIYEATRKNDVVLRPKSNSIILTISILLFTVLCFVTYRIDASGNTIRPFDYVMIKYRIDNNDLVKPYVDVDVKKIEKKHINPKIRKFLENGLIYDINEYRSNEDGIYLGIDILSKSNTKLKLKELHKEVLLKEKVEVLTDIKKIDVVSLEKVLKKYDIRYIDKLKYSLYYNENKIYLVQKISIDKLANSEMQKITKKDGFIYRIMCLGNVFVNEKNEVLSYSEINNKDLIEYINYKKEFKNYLEKNNMNEF